MAAYLVVLDDRDAIRWVLRERRMAFPATPRAEVRALTVGDRLFLYATRTAWHNPTRDRGRIIAIARAATAVQMLDEPIVVFGRTFASVCRLVLEGVVPYPGGLALQPLTAELDAFPKPEAWFAYLRRALVRLTDADQQLLDRRIEPLLRPSPEAMRSYDRS